jgi:hypothetical protein
MDGLTRRGVTADLRQIAPLDAADVFAASEWPGRNRATIHGMATKRLTQLEAAQKRVAQLHAAAIDDITSAIKEVEAGNRRLVDAIVAARELGITYRAMGERTSRSHEYYRGIVNRAAEAKKKKKKKKR